MNRTTLLILGLTLLACEGSALTIDDDGFGVPSGEGSPGLDLPGVDGPSNGGDDPPGNGSGDDDDDDDDDDDGSSSVGDDDDDDDDGASGDDDDDDDDDDDSGNSGGNNNPPGVSPCGALVPPDGPQTSRTRRFSGEVTLKTTGGLTPPYSTEWSGCEAERFFRADGTLECEIVYDVTGRRSGLTPGFGGTYELAIDVNDAETTCSGAQDIERLYRVNINLFGSDTLERAVQERGPWNSFGTISLSGRGDTRRFDYASPLYPPPP